MIVDGVSGGPELTSRGGGLESVEALREAACSARPWRVTPLAAPGARGPTSSLLVVLFPGDVGRRRRGDLSKTRKILGFYLCRLAVLATDGIVNFLAMDGHVLGGIDAQTDLVAADVNHGDFNVIADHNRLVSL